MNGWTTSLLALTAAAASASGCTCLTGGPVELAPEDLNGIFHWMFVNLTEAGDSQMADAAAKFHAATRAEALSAPKRGGLKSLTPEEIGAVGMQGKADPTVIRGFYVVTTFPCTLAKVETIIYALNQAELYEGAYTSYDRRYTSDFETYRSGRTDRLGWVADIGASILGSSFTEQIVGTLRRVPRAEQVETPFGPALFVRIHMPEPAKFDSSDASFDQDYQVQLFYERSPGQLVHGFGVWRRLELGAIGMSTDDDSVVNLVLDNLIDWDERTAELCAE